MSNILLPVNNNLAFKFEFLILFIQAMFFDSLIRRKQSVLASTAPHFESLPAPKQIFSPIYGARKEFYEQKNDNRMLIARCKSERQLNSNYFHGHLKHPILNKEKAGHRVIQQQQYRQGEHLKPGRQETLDKQKPVMCEKHRKNMESVKNSQKNLDFSEYDLKNYSKTPNSQKLQEMRQINSSLAMDFSPPFSQLKQNGSIIGPFDRSSSSSQFNLKSINKNIMSPFSIENNKYMDNETTKLIDMEYESNLRETVKSLQKKILTISEQRDKDKNKLLEYSLNMDKLKTENEILKKSSSKSKQNIDIKNRGGQMNELKRAIRQEIEAKQSLLKDKQSALTQLNEALNAHQLEKQKWEKEKRNMQTRIESLTNENRERLKQNLLLVQNINGVCQKNKNLRQNYQKLECELIQKQNQAKWMGLKVNELKEALQFIKIHGNSRILKLEQELLSVENKRKQSAQGDIKNLQAKVQEKEVKIKQLEQELQSQRYCCEDLKQTIQRLDKYVKQMQVRNQAMMSELLSKEAQVENLKALIQENANEKNKVIQALAKNISEASIEKQILKNEKLKLEQEQMNNYRNQATNFKIKVNDLQKQLATEIQKSLKQHEHQILTQQNLFEVQKSKQILLKKVNDMQMQNKYITAELQRTRKYTSSLSEVKGSQENEIAKIKGYCADLEREKEQLLKKSEQESKLLNEKIRKCQIHESQLQLMKKQLLLSKQQLKNALRQNQATQMLLVEKDKQITKLNEQLWEKSKVKSEEQMQKLDLGQKKIQQEVSKITYGQLEMRLCSVLGIYLTNSIDKLINPIEELMKSKRIYESSQKFYQQVLRLFDIKQGEYGRLMGEIRQLKNGYGAVVQRSRGLQEQVCRYKQQNNYLMDRVEWGASMTKKLEGMVDDQNEIIVKLRLKFGNEKYNCSGLRKC